MPRRDLISDLRALTQAAGSAVLSLSSAAAALELPHREATLRMRALVRLGLARRLRRGLFFIIPVKPRGPHPENPHDKGSVAAALFHPCYIGGWTAAEAHYLYFGSESDFFVVTARRVRSRSVVIGGNRFRLAHLPEWLVTDPGIVFRRGDAAATSDPDRTVVDALRSPSWLGGAQPLADALRGHCRSDRWDPDRFIDVLLQAGNGAAIKRLAALNELMGLDLWDVVQAAAECRTQGIVELEPGAGSGGRIDTRSGVRLNVELAAEDGGGDFGALDEDDLGFLDEDGFEDC